MGEMGGAGGVAQNEIARAKPIRETAILCTKNFNEMQQRNKLYAAKKHAVQSTSYCSDES